MGRRKGRLERGVDVGGKGLAARASSCGDRLCACKMAIACRTRVICWERGAGRSSYHRTRCSGGYVAPVLQPNRTTDGHAALTALLFGKFPRAPAPHRAGRVPATVP